MNGWMKRKDVLCFAQFPASEDGILSIAVIRILIPIVDGNDRRRCISGLGIPFHLFRNNLNLLLLLFPFLHLRFPFSLPFRFFPPLHLISLRWRFPLRPLLLQPFARLVFAFEPFPGAFLFGLVIVVTFGLRGGDAGFVFLVRGCFGEAGALGGDFLGAGGGKEILPVLEFGVVACSRFGLGDSGDG